MLNASFFDELLESVRKERDAIQWTPDNTSVSVADKASRIENWPSIVIDAWEFIKTQKKGIVVVDHTVVNSIPKGVIVKAYYNYYYTGSEMIYILKDEEYFEPEIAMSMPLRVVFILSNY